MDMMKSLPRQLQEWINKNDPWLNTLLDSNDVSHHFQLNQYDSSRTFDLQISKSIVQSWQDHMCIFLWSWKYSISKWKKYFMKCIYFISDCFVVLQSVISQTIDMLITIWLQTQPEDRQPRPAPTTMSLVHYSK